MTKQSKPTDEEIRNAFASSMTVASDMVAKTRDEVSGEIDIIRLEILMTGLISVISLDRSSLDLYKRINSVIFGKEMI